MKVWPVVIITLYLSFHTHIKCQRLKHKGKTAHKAGFSTIWEITYPEESNRLMIHSRWNTIWTKPEFGLADLVALIKGIGGNEVKYSVQHYKYKTILSMNIDSMPSTSGWFCSMWLITQSRLNWTQLLRKHACVGNRLSSMSNLNLNHVWVNHGTICRGDIFCICITLLFCIHRCAGSYGSSDPDP